MRKQAKLQFRTDVNVHGSVGQVGFELANSRERRGVNVGFEKSQASIG